MGELTTKQRLFVEALRQGLGDYATIYGIRANGEAEYFYIGSTVKSLDERFAAHMNAVRRCRHNNRRFAAKVQSVGRDQCKAEVIELCDVSDRFEREYYHIRATQKHGVKLTNIVSSVRQQEYIRESRRLIFLRLVRVLCEFQLNGAKRMNEPLVAELVDATRRDLQKIFRDDALRYIAEYGEEMYSQGLRYVTDRGVLPHIGIGISLQRWQT